jgi:hypothetical protein
MSKYLKNKPVNIDTTGGYTVEQIHNNKNCSKDPKYWYNIEGTDKYLFRSKCAESWEFFDPQIVNPIRNTNQIYLKFKDISAFIEPSNYFREYECYTYEIEDTIGGEAFWDDLEKKILTGFVYEGVRITGRHFFTINFGRFSAIPVDELGNSIKNTKVYTFLRFLDHQYYVFHELDECLLEGVYDNKKIYLDWFPDKTIEDFESLKMQSFVGAKSRRKGWSAIEGIGLVAYNFTWKENSHNLIAVYEKEHYKPIFRAIKGTKSFIDQYTPWKRVTEIKGTATHFIAGVNTRDEYGIPIQEGYLSEVNALSFQDNAYKGIGSSEDIIIVEEPGKFNTLEETYPVSIEPLIRDGEIPIGIAVLAGTAGDIEGGGSVALAKMMYNPRSYNFKSYSNIYEREHHGTESGWFIDDLWYLPDRVLKKDLLLINDDEYIVNLLKKFEGTYVDIVDKQGNSHRVLADLILTKKRNEKRNVDIKGYNKLITQQPKYLSEAFLINESSPFDTATATAVLSELISRRDKLPIEKGTFILTPNGIEWKLDLSLKEIAEFPFDTSKENSDGCWVLYEKPDKEKNTGWRYVSGNDPIDFGRDESAKKGNHSLSATYIIDTLTRNIVAEYVGRPSTADMYYEQLWRGIEFYKSRLLYENNLVGLYSYFKSKNKLWLLADEPESLKNASFPGYKSAGKTKGFHATKPVNAHARKLIHSWSMESIVQSQDDEGNNIFIPRMWTIKSIGLLQEIIKWNSLGNFDRISGLSAAMIILFDRNYDEDYDSPDEGNMFTKGIFETLRKKMITTNRLNFKQYAN